MPDELESVHISKLKFDPKNARRRTERSSYMIRSSLEKFGGMRSIVVNEDLEVKAGNGTLEEAGQIGIEKVRIIEADGNELIAVKRRGLTDAEWKEYAIADNRSSDLSEWSSEVLAELSQEVDLSGLFTGDELSELLGDLATGGEGGGTGEDDEDATADDVEKAEAGEIESRVSLGQIWRLGRHFICCADSTKEENIRSLMKAAKVNTVGMVWADPPFGINLHTSYKGAKSKQRVNYAPVIGDDSLETVTKAFELCNKLQDSIGIWWGANHYSRLVPPSPCWIVWDKKEEGDFEVTLADCELAWTNADAQARVFKHLWRGFRRDSEQGEKRSHPTQKPIKLCEWAFEKFGKSSDTILDPFLGSAPSIIAAQQMEGERTVIGFELSEAYCEVICRRFTRVCGIVPELVGTI